MNSLHQAAVEARHSVFEPASHSLHECRTTDEFWERFAASTGHMVPSVADSVVSSEAPKAIFLVGSIPLGMATAGSDIDFVVLIESNSAVLRQPGGGVINDDQRFAFVNESSPLVAGGFVALQRGIAVELQVVIAPNINRVFNRLRGRGPELSETEIMILGRLSTGWLVWESPGFLQRNAINLTDPALLVYCSTKHFVSALIAIRKAAKVVDCGDIPLALNLGRVSVEMAYLAYFASEGYAYLGTKWLAQLGHARSAAERVGRQPLLKESLPLLFPSYESTATQAKHYLEAVTAFLGAMRTLIEQKTLFRIAFHACPQIHDIQRGRGD